MREREGERERERGRERESGSNWLDSVLVFVCIVVEQIVTATKSVRISRIPLSFFSTSSYRCERE